MYPMNESYQLPDGRMFDNQRDAEIAAGALGRCEWMNATTMGSTTCRYVLKAIVPLQPSEIRAADIAQLLHDGRYDVRTLNGKIVEISLVA